jgi:hypothetical protein
MAKRSKPHPDLFIEHADVAAIPSKRIRWQSACRLIPSRYPPIDLFERIAPASDWDALIELEGMTNPRLREEAGAISLVPVSRRVSGPGASIVMAPFTHASKERPTRFSDGSYGVYYAAQRFETSLREVAFHMGRFHAATRDKPLRCDYRGYQGKVANTFSDLTSKSYPELLGPDIATYGAAQRFARMLRESNGNGIVYPSQRHEGGKCLAAFWPDVVAIPVQTRHVALRWDGEKMSDWFDYEENRWSAL